MNVRFEKIIKASRYDLRCDWSNKRINIANEILLTFNNFGQDGVTQKHFDEMIRKITDGASNSGMYCKRDPNIITNICICFPN
jgi:hypothetical protein